MVEPNTATDIAIERVSMFFDINAHFLSYTFFSKRLRLRESQHHMANASEPGKRPEWMSMLLKYYLLSYFHTYKGLKNI